MGYAIGTVTKGGGDDCHYQILGIIKTLAEANGWTTLRYVNTGSDREWIGKSLGLSGSEEIYIGFRTYQDVGVDYYNLLAGTFVGYIAESTFDAQPGAQLAGIPAHNNAITYFMTANAQRIVFCLKVGTPVYEHGYAGKMFPYARPGEFPSPLIVGGMLAGGAEARRFSDANQQFPYGGRILGTSGTSACAMWMRDQTGTWEQRYHYPFSNGSSRTNALFGTQGSSTLVPATTDYQLEPIILQDQASTNTDPSNVYGELDGVYFISGFNNGVENVAQMGGSSVIDQTGMTVKQAVDAIRAVGGRAFVVLQNVNRTTWADYIALEMK